MDSQAIRTGPPFGNAGSKTKSTPMGGNAITGIKFILKNNIYESIIAKYKSIYTFYQLLGEKHTNIIY